MVFRHALVQLCGSQCCSAWHHGIQSPGLDPFANLDVPPTLAVPSFMPGKGRPFDRGELRGSRAGMNGRCSRQGNNGSQGDFNTAVPSRTQAAEAGSVLHASCRRLGHVGSWLSPRSDVASARSSRTNHLMATQTAAPRARQKVQASWSSFCGESSTMHGVSGWWDARHTCCHPHRCWGLCRKRRAPAWLLLRWGLGLETSLSRFAVARSSAGPTCQPEGATSRRAASSRSCRAPAPAPKLRCQRPGIQPGNFG